VRRRLLLALAGLTAAILIGAVIPLGYQASAHDYSAYVEDAQSRARSAAAAAEELLADQLTGTEPLRDRAAAVAAGHGGDGLAILSPGGRVIARSGPRVVVPRAEIRRAARRRRLVSTVSHDHVLVVVPVLSGGTTVGIVALLRPTERLEYGLRTFWLTLVMIALGALVAAVLIGLGLARWGQVGGPAAGGAGRRGAQAGRRGPVRPRARRGLPGGVPPARRHVQHDGRTAGEPGARASRRRRGRVAPAPDAAGGPALAA
jgi:hypothetical protein